MERIFLMFLTLTAAFGCATNADEQAAALAAARFSVLEVKLAPRLDEARLMQVMQYKPNENLRPHVEKEMQLRKLLGTDAQPRVLQRLQVFVTQFLLSAGADTLAVEVLVTDASGAQIDRFEEKASITWQEREAFSNAIDRANNLYRRVAANAVGQLQRAGR